MSTGLPAQRSINMEPEGPMVEQLDSNSTDVDVVNTAATQVIYSVVVPARSMGTNRVVRTRVVGDYLNNSGASRGLNLRIRFGGVTIFQTSFPVIAIITVSAVRRAAFWEFHLSNRGVANSQLGGGSFGLSDAFVNTTGIGPVGDMANNFGGPIGSDVVAVDTTIDQTLDFSVQNEFASATLSFRKRFAYTDIANEGA